VGGLEQNRIPCAPVLNLHEAMAHPHCVSAVRCGALGTG
jgi:hypothetical protein